MVELGYESSDWWEYFIGDAQYRAVTFCDLFFASAISPSGIWVTDKDPETGQKFLELIRYVEGRGHVSFCAFKIKQLTDESI